MRHWRSPHSVWPRAAHPAQWDVSRQRMSPHKRQLWFRQTLEGSDIKAKVKSSFSSSALRFTYNTTGTKSCSYLRLREKRGGVVVVVVMVITSFTVEEEDADSPAPIHVERMRKSIVCKSAQDCSGGPSSAHLQKKRWDEKKKDWGGDRNYNLNAW